MKDRKTTIPNDADIQRQDLDRMGQAIEKDPYEGEKNGKRK